MRPSSAPASRPTSAGQNRAKSKIEVRHSPMSPPVSRGNSAQQFDPPSRPSSATHLVPPPSSQSIPQSSGPKKGIKSSSNSSLVDPPALQPTVSTASSTMFTLFRGQTVNSQTLPELTATTATHMGKTYFKFAGKVNRLGLILPSEHHFSFATAGDNNQQTSTRVLYGRYTLFPTHTKYFRSNLSGQAKVADAAFDEILQGVLAIQKEANGMNRTLRRLLLLNPYLSFSAKGKAKVTDFFFDGILYEFFQHDHKRSWNIILACIFTAGMVPMFFLLSYYLTLGLVAGLGGLVDLAMLRFLWSNNEAQVAWFRKSASESKILDNVGIDSHIADRLQTLADSVTKRHPGTQLIVWRGAERDEHWDIIFERYFRYKEEIMLVINPPNQHFGQNFHTLV